MNLYYNYKIWQGLFFAKKFSEKSEDRKQAYFSLKEKLLSSNQSSGAISGRDLRYLANEISPGLGHVDIIHEAIDAALQKRALQQL